MSESLPSLDIASLSVPQRLALISELWDSLPESPEALAMPAWHREELERRLAAADASPDTAIPWKQVQQTCHVGSMTG